MGWSNNKLTKPIGLGDISVATGIGGPPYSLGNMIASSTIINQMAVYKPVKSSNPGELTYAERKATRFGFGSITSKQLNPFASTPVLTNDWVYEKPTAGQPNEWFRALDFDGYVSNAVAPLAVSIGQLVYDDKSYILLYGNDKVNALGRAWVSGESLSIGELLEGGGDYYGSYIAFIIQDATSGGVNYVVTNTTFSSFINSGYGLQTFTLKGDGQGETISGLFHPGIPILQSSRSGHTFNVIVCLSVGGASSGNAYDVYTSGAYTPYSLGFTSGCDRGSAVLGSGAFTMDGTQITSFTITGTDMVTEITWNNIVWRAYNVSVEAVFSTANKAYSGQKSISGTLSISNGQSYVFGPTPSSGSSSLSVAVATNNLIGSTANQGRTIFSAGSDKYLWVMKYNGSYISTNVSASVSYDYPFNTALTASASKNIP